MPVIRITAFQRQAQQQVLNVYYYDYQGELSPTILEDLFDDFVVTVINPVRNIQSQQLTYEEVEIVDMSNPLGPYARFPLNLAGTLSGDPLPTFAAWSFKALVATRATRPGGKRIGGVAESSTTDGITPIPAFMAVIELARQALGNSLEAPAGVFGFPVIVSFNPRISGQPQTIRATQVIRDHTVPRISSQVTRRIGRGS